MNRAYELAKDEVGTVEWADGSNPKVVAYFRDAGHPTVTDDATAWCAAFIGAMLKRSGLKGTGMLTARSYLNWGNPIDIDDARPGDIVVFKRGSSTWQGHVGFFVKRSGAFIEVLGGNQSNAVNIQRYAIANLLGVRRADAWDATENPAPPPPVVPPRPKVLTPKPVTTPQPGGILAAVMAFFSALMSALRGRR